MMAMNATDLQAQGVVPAQKGEKTFTLEDLNFGGNNYRNMVAKNRWCTWWGNELVRQDVDACYLSTRRQARRPSSSASMTSTSGLLLPKTSR